jgi:hypothetical protein
MTDILRTYIEERFDVQAIEMTTDEILQGMKGTDADKEAMDKLANTLVLADLVKFAKENPLPLDNDTSMNNSIAFVRETKSDKEVEEIMEKVRIENGEEISLEETIEGSSIANTQEDDSFPDKDKEEII